MTARLPHALVTVLLLAALAACGGPGPTVEPPAAGPSTKNVPSPTAAPATSATSGQLPDLVGKGLQYAQDAAQSAGFRALTSHDSTGRERLQVSDRNWKVCFQSPPAGPADPQATVDFGVVKLEEPCPAKDAAPSSAAAKPPATMPNVEGKSLRAAEEALGASASLEIRDATGKDRAVLVSTNWQICAQKPAAGAPFAGVPVTLHVVKYGERCP